MLSVLYVVDVDQYFGSPNELLVLLKAFQKQNQIRPVVLTAISGPLNKRLNNLGIENHVIGRVGWYVGTDRKWKKLVKRLATPFFYCIFKYQLFAAIRHSAAVVDFSKIDLIHTNVSINPLGAYLAAKYHLPHIWHLRETFTTSNLFFTVPGHAIDFMRSHANRFVAISKYVANSWQTLGLPADKICQIADGIDSVRITDVDRKHPSTADLKIVQIGSISDFKGQVRLIRALALLPEKVRKNFQVDFIGDGDSSYINQLKSLITQEKMADICHFRGYVANAMTHLQDYQVGIVSSPEGFGLTTVEYMMAGLIVVAENSGANGELISDGHNGILYSAGSVSDLAMKLNFLVEQPEKMRNLAYRATKESVSRYDINKTASEILTLYADLLSDKEKRQNK
ncbi:glycosyltransferase family 4 protein [Oenococcus sp.]|uniref:glycosyltransferase family 4 protein n=1 Tax=Oenococcus sp. TaxID=1979414 RepID=UPI0039EC81B4